MKPPLTKTQLRLIDHFSNRRFDCEFWSSPNVRQVIRQLLEQIKYLEEMNIEHRTSNIERRIKKQQGSE
jgi:hypothetical protein